MKRWVSSAVIYQVNLRALAAREPRNAFEAAYEKRDTRSPLAYLTKNLPLLKKLGVNVLYLMPPYPMGLQDRKGIGSPYSIHDFRGVDPEHGTLDELADFVRRAHKSRMRVILDITPNHTSRDHEWVSSHPEYYVKDSLGAIFYDADWSDTAKLDYANADLRREMVGVYDYWLSFLGPGRSGLPALREQAGQPDGVDGFRLDMAHLINDRGFWNQAVPELRARHPDRELLFLAECYGTQNNLDLFSRGINAAYDDDFYKVCQYLYALSPAGQSVIRPSPEAKGNADFLDKYEAFKVNGIAGAMEAALLNYESTLPPGEDSPRLARYTDNHDEGRGLYRFGEGAVRAVSQLAFFSNHCIPFLLTGQEFGALNRPSIHNRIGPCDKGRRILRADGAHAEEGVEFEGNLFARTPDERAAWYRFYRELIQLRLKNRELTHGKFLLVDVGEACRRPERTVVAFERRLRRSAIRCAVNLGPEPRRLGLASLFEGKVLYGSLEGDVLLPFSSVVVRLETY
ncbi:MAG: alpha-amylase family glycosyl hydrolase [Verrucomicrobiota bacterium]